MVVDEDEGYVAMITELNLATSAKIIEWFLTQMLPFMFVIIRIVLVLMSQSEIFMRNHASV